MLITFQQIILTLQAYWSQQGCALLQPIDMEVGAGTSHVHTFLRAISPEPWRAAYVQASRRPKDGRYGVNPNRLQHYYQYQVVLKPSPENIFDVYLDSLKALGFDLKQNDVRFVEDDWENPTLDAWGLGWEVWINGMEITQFTYFQQVGGFDCRPMLGEITYGLERLAMYLQKVENIYDLVWTEWKEQNPNGSTKSSCLTYGDIYYQNEVEQSKYNFEQANIDLLFTFFNSYKTEAKRMIRNKLTLPAYELVLKAAHTFNLLDARGAISVTERATYIGDIRTLSRLVAQAYYDSRARVNFPMLDNSEHTVCQNSAPMKEHCNAHYVNSTSKGQVHISQEATESTQSIIPTNHATLLVELLTEELPPKALVCLSDTFAQSIAHKLAAHDLIEGELSFESYATPQRLAVIVKHVRSVVPGKQVREKLLPVSVAFDANGQPTAPLVKKLAMFGFHDFRMLDLERALDGKNEMLFIKYVAPNVRLTTELQAVLDETFDISNLPILRMMTYQSLNNSNIRFIRPVRRLTVLHGENIVPVNAFGINASNITRGHRFLSDKFISIPHADAYKQTLLNKGYVISNFADRKETIRSYLLAHANGDQVIMPEALLNEVTALVEWPIVYDCHFEDEFLQVPQECLILTMQTNQRYFALADSAGKLRARFLIVSNIETKTPTDIITGNERVVHSRLTDAKFFFEHDKKKRLSERVPLLANVVYHNKLGSQLQRIERLEGLARVIASMMGVDISLATLGARLAKADLLTDMVGEFPELQGTMGTYYARHDREPEEIALTCREHYQPRFADDILPVTMTGTVVALADKLEILVGIWGIGLQPTGGKDPFALRRHALGVLRLIIEKQLPLDLSKLLRETYTYFSTQPNVVDSTDAIYKFCMDRLHSLLHARGYAISEIDAVLSLNPTRLDDIVVRLDAVHKFTTLTEAAALIAVNKRISNFLKKSETLTGGVKTTLLIEVAEKALHAQLEQITPRVQSQLTKRQYINALTVLTELREPVDTFFNSVTIKAENPSLRANRLALLSALHQQMNCVAKISQLVT